MLRRHKTLPISAIHFGYSILLYRRYDSSSCLHPPSSILLYVKVVDSFISLSTFLLEFFLRLTLQLPSRKSGSERVITSRGMTQQGEDINSATEGRVSRD
ncbi:unnamed protein product [Brassica oleracea]|uniref:(rape) hypothetical protein n=1 Tax=Brassica napus TaxID=3708 RepID=A0A816RA50_BRANA|nr:unnamed protein product [Brassica napus]